MSAAFSPSFMVMQRPLGSTTAFSIDSLIGGPPQPSPGHFVYTGYPMFMPYRSVVLPPPPPPALSQSALQQALPATHPHHQIPSLQNGFCSSLAQGMALTSTLMASLPGGFSASQQHQEAARKFGSQSLHAVFDKTQDIRLDGDDGKTFLGKESAALQAFHDSESVQSSTGRQCSVSFSLRDHTYDRYKMSCVCSSSNLLHDINKKHSLLFIIFFQFSKTQSPFYKGKLIISNTICSVNNDISYMLTCHFHI